MANFCECRKSSTRKARSEPSLQAIIAIHLAEKKEDFPGRGNRTETFPSKGQEGPCACLRGAGQGICLRNSYEGEHAGLLQILSCRQVLLELCF